MFEVFLKVDKGMSSHENQDRACVVNEVISDATKQFKIDDFRLMTVLCDGVGGAKRGEVAAMTAAKTFADFVEQDIVEENILALVKKANEAILDVQMSDIDLSTTSTTLVGLYIENNNYIAFNAGNSRVSRFRAPYISQITTDHTLVAELLEMGIIDSIEKADPRQKSTITRYLGSETRFAPDILQGEGKVRDGDIFLLSTDGMHDFLSNKEIEDVLNDSNISYEAMIERLHNKAIENGSRDNISIILIIGHL